MTHKQISRLHSLKKLQTVLIQQLVILNRQLSDEPTIQQQLKNAVFDAESARAQIILILK